MKYRIRMEYTHGSETAVLNGSADDICNITMSAHNGITKLTLNSKKEISIQSFRIILPYTFSKDCRIFANGFQSWTDTREYMPNEKMDGLSKVVEAYINSPAAQFTGLNRAGDCTFHKFPRKKGIFYGFSYGYVRSGERTELIGSMSERTGYTIITYNTSENLIYIEKDLEGKTFLGENEIMSFAVIGGNYDAVFDKYFSLLEIPAPRAERACGYTTWYNYYSDVTEEIVERDLKAIGNSGVKINFFQIDDGYQSAIGDWLTTDQSKFPRGMKAIADEIHKNGIKAGLWLAPFAATKKSSVYKDHPEWLVKDSNSKPYLSGPNWGTFYALDIYNDDAREYIRKVFNTVLNDWGYDLVKLDFLYAAAILPRNGKTRGEIMCDAMDLLRECCGDKLILGCGVPLMPAFGKVDYCRIGSDISLSWHHRRHSTREDVSTPHAVSNTIFRRHLNGRAWMNDPDVFLLRDENIKMDFNRRKLLSKINSVFGSLLFVSDNVGKYNSEQLQALKNAFKKEDYTILSADFIEPHIMKVKFSYGNRTEELTFDIWNGTIISDKVN